MFLVIGCDIVLYKEFLKNWIKMKTMGDVVAAPPIEDNASSVTDLGHHPSVGKELGQRTLRSLKRGLGRLWRRHRGNASITEYDPCYKVAYLGNVLTGWAKGQYNCFIMYLNSVQKESHSPMTWKGWFRYVPEVLNVHVNENNKKNLLFLEVFFCQAVKN